jgi:hypothetical protein
MTGGQWTRAVVLALCLSHPPLLHLQPTFLSFDCIYNIATLNCVMRAYVVFVTLQHTASESSCSPCGTDFCAVVAFETV